MIIPDYNIMTLQRLHNMTIMLIQTFDFYEVIMKILKKILLYNIQKAVVQL